MANRRQWALAALAGASLATLGLGCATAIEFEGRSSGGGDEEEGTSGPVNPPPCPTDCSKAEAPQCVVSVCNPDTHQCELVPGPKDEPCDDGLFCTVGESCEDGVCGEGAPNSCGVLIDDCSEVLCDEASQTCSSMPLPDGFTCAIGDDLCIVNAQCQSGVCVGAPKDCFFAPVPDVCHVSVCDPETGGCVPMVGNNGGSCPDDGDLCKVNKTCQAGVCQGGQAKDCSGLTNGCNNGVCDAATGDCFEEPIAPGGMCLEATNECNAGICDNNGSCNPVPLPGVACGSGTDACHAGTCDASGVCVSAPANDGASCEDGNACTTGETCLAGACQGGVVGSYVVYFNETFASNSAGWTLGQDWEIGPAVESVGLPSGFPDPAEDHTPSADNGLAGVVIGGSAPEVIHPQYYLVSPVINTDVMGPVYLEFWRWLNSDYTPYMKNTIDVFDGVAWQSLWETGDYPGVEDSAWTHVTHELTAYKNPNMQIRFGFEIGSSGVYTIGSWSVDDVVIANAVCN